MSALDVRPRETSIDLVRSIGVIAIVSGHVWDTTLSRDLLYTWHVPVFFFISGYLWTSGRTVRGEVVRRSKTLLKPYVFWWAALIVPYIAVLAVSSDLTFRNIIAPLYGGAAVGRPFTTFWFVFALFATAVIWRALERTPVTVRASVVVFAIALTPFAGPMLALTPLAIGAALPALSLLAAGQIARRYEPQRATPSVVIAVALILAAATATWAGVVTPLDIKRGEWGAPIVSLVAAAAISWALVLAAKVLSPHLGRLGNAVTWFSLCGFTIVLAHPAVIWVAEPFLPTLVVFALALAVPVVIAQVAMRTPISQWVTGVPSRARKHNSRI
ncbi:acyltransferase family protein [Agromyces sp. NPDC049794]|uniref:acyltransferase family protein n=1 Tax=unclassified Agromyces TaxID=2639701 RepID=UPI0033E7C851